MSALTEQEQREDHAKIDTIGALVVDVLGRGKTGNVHPLVQASPTAAWWKEAAEGVRELLARPPAQVVLSPADRTAIVDELMSRLGPELRAIVDQELDEQARAGADAD